MFTVKLPKILCLALAISKDVKGLKYFNTNDLINVANKKKADLVRLRKDKKPYAYKYLEDTNFGGLRGNFSTLLTLCGLIEKNNRPTSYYSIGKNDRLINAVNKGHIILDNEDFEATTDSLDLKIQLENEAKYLSIREGQAHIAAFLRNNPTFPLKRDDINFKKICVLKSQSNQFFFRTLFNTYIKPNIIEYNMLSYFSGPKIKKQNIHALFVIPSETNNWNEFYAIDAKELLTKPRLFLYFDTNKKEFTDKDGNIYPSVTLNDALLSFTNEYENISERIAYNPQEEINKFVTKSISVKTSKTITEELVFIRNFLNNSLDNLIFIKGKQAQKYEIYKAGVDVVIEFQDGTKQTLELEHKWTNYILHGHQNSIAWKDAWIYANEPFDFAKIKTIFEPYKGLYIPSVFLSSDPLTKTVKAYEVDWSGNTYVELPIEFH